MAIRGDIIYTVLERLVREGAITTFKLMDGMTETLGVLHVAVTADIVTDLRQAGYNKVAIEAVRERVAAELRCFATDVVVSVRSSRPQQDRQKP